MERFEALFKLLCVGLPEYISASLGDSPVLVDLLPQGTSPVLTINGEFDLDLRELVDAAVRGFDHVHSASFSSDFTIYFNPNNVSIVEKGGSQHFHIPELALIHPDQQYRLHIWTRHLVAPMMTRAEVNKFALHINEGPLSFAHLCEVLSIRSALPRRWHREISSQLKSLEAIGPTWESLEFCVPKTLGYYQRLAPIPLPDESTNDYINRLNETIKDRIVSNDALTARLSLLACCGPTNSILINDLKLVDGTEKLNSGFVESLDPFSKVHLLAWSEIESNVQYLENGDRTKLSSDITSISIDNASPDGHSDIALFNALFCFTITTIQESEEIRSLPEAWKYLVSWIHAGSVFPQFRELGVSGHEVLDWVQVNQPLGSTLIHYLSLIPNRFGRGFTKNLLFFPGLFMANVMDAADSAIKSNVTSSAFHRIVEELKTRGYEETVQALIGLAGPSPLEVASPPPYSLIRKLTSRTDYTGGMLEIPTSLKGDIGDLSNVEGLERLKRVLQAVPLDEETAAAIDTLLGSLLDLDLSISVAKDIASRYISLAYFSLISQNESIRAKTVRIGIRLTEYLDDNDILEILSEIFIASIHENQTPKTIGVFSDAIIAASSKINTPSSIEAMRSFVDALSSQLPFESRVSISRCLALLGARTAALAPQNYKGD